ncbi:MAG TPA: adenylate/guanylate cyclase domain-containing protein [Candidatus Dormibacteraeota bacterium]|nr:adenylate/guanylate cyclase domain-containing protein [Candidatus Dormibacteraeota bacterium]
MGRYIRYWYTYRTAVAVLTALALTGAMYWLYVQQLTCDSHAEGCLVNVSVHPEDRLFSETSPDPNIVVVGIDDASISALRAFPVPRSTYASALRHLQDSGAAVVAFDVSMPDPREEKGDAALAAALRTSTIPVVLAYGGEDTITRNGFREQTSSTTNPLGVDQIPLKQFWCGDPNTESNVSCANPYRNVILASTDVAGDADGVIRRMPMFVQPACYSTAACPIERLNPLGFAAFRAFALGTDFATGPSLQESGGQATFGTTWPTPLSVDSTGSALVNYAVAPGGFKKHDQYLSFSDVANGSFSADKVKGKIVLVGAYYLTGVHDEFSTPAAGGTPMPGVEIHANVIQMMLPAPPKFLTPESPVVLLVIMLVLSVATAVGVARVTVLWGFAGTVGALVLFTVGMAALSVFNGWVPDLFHPWLAIALTYTGVTAYRFLYEDREKRKVTALFGTYLKPEIVAELAKTRGGVDDILRGGERRDITLMFVDIRGFTSMAESMAATDVTEVVQMYLDHLSGIIFTWDGTVDKYVGDEVMAFWNAPRLQSHHALLAIRCAYDCVNRGPELQQKLLARGLPPIRWGIGINSGPAVVGNMGSRSRLQYTALGDTVNTAARFCSHAPAFEVLIGQETYELCRDYIAVDLVPGVQLKGKSAERFRIYRVTAIREAPDAPWVQFPSELATQAHQAFTTQYTQQTVLAAAETGSSDILVGEEAERALADQARGQSPN